MKYLKLFENYDNHDYYQEITKSDWDAIFWGSYPSLGKFMSDKMLKLHKRDIEEISSLFPKNEIRTGKSKFLDRQSFKEGDKQIFTDTLREEYSEGAVIIYSSEEKKIKTYQRRNIYYKIPVSLRPSNDNLFLKKQYQTEVRRHDSMMIIKTEDDYYYVYTVGVFKDGELVQSKFNLDEGYDVNRYFKCDQIDGLIELIEDLKKGN